MSTEALRAILYIDVGVTHVYVCVWMYGYEYAGTNMVASRSPV